MLHSDKDPFPGLTGWAGAIVLALVLNALMFGLMPGLLTDVSDHRELPGLLHPVNVFRVKRPEPPLPEKRKPKPEEREKPPEAKTISGAVQKEKPVTKPRLPFAINPRLPAGPGIVPTIDPGKFTTADKGLFNLSDLDRPLQILMQIKPRRPLKADRMGIEGWVMIKYVINEQGRVEQAEVIDARPAGVFEKAVLDAAPLWRFSPPTVAGAPVKVWAEQKIVFNFENE
jgi:protein TonB